MAHRVHRGLSLLDVLRSAEPGERMQRALQGVCGAPDGGAAALRTLLTDGGECTEPARLAAFDALMSSGSGASVGTLHELAAAGGKGLDLYRAARLLHIGALLRHCRTATSDSEGAQGNGAAQRDENLAELDEAQHAEAPPLDEDEAAKLEALSEAGLACVGDLVRYCSDDEDLEQHVAALSLELLGALDRPTIRKLVTEGRALCEATALLPSGGGEAWEAPPDDAEPAEPLLPRSGGLRDMPSVDPLDVAATSAAMQEDGVGNSQIEAPAHVTTNNQCPECGSKKAVEKKFACRPHFLFFKKDISTSGPENHRKSNN